MPEQSISIVIPTFNAAKFLPDALESLFAQTLQPQEIIIVDDGSTDETSTVVRRWGTRVRYVRKTHRGISATRNTGIRMAKGAMIAFLDADDVWLPQKLELQFKYLTTHPMVSVVFTLGQNTYDPRKTSNFPVINAHIPCNCMFRSDLIKTVGFFNTDIPLGEFADWYIRAKHAGVKMGTVRKLLILRRIHGNNQGIREKNNQLQYVRILKQKLDDERKQLLSQRG